MTTSKTTDPSSSLSAFSGTSLSSFQVEFIQFAIECGLLKFGLFLLKSGRQSPYFIDLGVIHSGQELTTLLNFYYEALKKSCLWKNHFNNCSNKEEHGTTKNLLVKERSPILYGPPYKGILLCAGLAMKIDSMNETTTTLNEKEKEKHDLKTPFCYSRKEIKDHGEGGLFVGYPIQTPSDSSTTCFNPSSGVCSLENKNNINDVNKEIEMQRPVMIIDDVLTAGSAVSQSLNLLKKACPQRKVIGLLLAIDREERPSEDLRSFGSAASLQGDNSQNVSSVLSCSSELTTSQYLTKILQIEVVSIIRISELILYLEELKENLRSPFSKKEKELQKWLLDNNGLENMKEYLKKNC